MYPRAATLACCGPIEEKSGTRDFIRLRLTGTGTLGADGAEAAANCSL